MLKLTMVGPQISSFTAIASTIVGVSLNKVSITRSSMAQGISGLLFHKEVCQNCGDRGYHETLICCFKCNDAFMHRYCMDDASSRFKEDAQWACYDCKLMAMKLDKSSLSTLKRSKNVSSKNVEETNAVMVLKKRVKVSQDMMKIREDEKPSEHLTNVSLSKHDSLENKLNEGENNTSSLGKIAGVDSKPKVTDRTDVENGDCCERAPSAEIVPFREAVSSFSDNLIDIHHVPAQPIVEPIWKGCFGIRTDGYTAVDGLVAHLSSKACLEVHKEACLFPAVLHMDIVHKSSVWPKRFMLTKPSDDDIALYFFPEWERVEEDFDSLVDDMIGNELAIRCLVENAELLVFNSTELPLGHWRFRGKHYLWGVFRAKRPALQANDHYQCNGSNEKATSSDAQASSVTEEYDSGRDRS